MTTVAPFTVETIAEGFAIAIHGGHVVVPGLDFARAVAQWDETWPRLQDLAARTSPADVIRGAKPVPQFGGARKVLCAGANYYKHLAEMNVTFTKDATKAPFFFGKPPTALATDRVPMDASITMLDWEVELVAIVGKRGRDIPLEHALAHVAGYAVAIDVTARDRLFQPESIFKFDFFAGKGQDGFCPTSTAMLPARFLPDPQATRIRLAVNGVTKQDASTSDMIYGVAELISWASKIATLEPGDVILTGSPEGVGFPKREFLKVGDRIRSELDPLLAFDCEVACK
jgi:2-keto-4-pentenoate hydratase/2-oxohepta-3-ene-1,7-dioic acid hydratase in catechol pathway